MRIWKKCAAIILLVSGTCFGIDSDKLSCVPVSAEEKSILRDFFLAMLSSSECGYVLYGNKPICFMSLAAPGNDPVGTLGHRLSVDLNNGIRVWKMLGMPQSSSNFILHIYDYSDENEWVHLLLINREAFYRVVSDNLSLFQYILGPCVTPEKLLTQLLNPKENFFSVFKDNKVLIGMVLGYGTNNALYVNRLELIQEKLNETLDTSPPLEPSFGYSSLNEEYQDLDTKISLSSKSLASEAPRLYFGCLSDSNETKPLINHYEEVQLAIIEVLESSDFLEKVLKKFFCNEQLILLDNTEAVELLRKQLLRVDREDIETATSNISMDMALQSAPLDWSSVVAHCLWKEYASWSASIGGEHFLPKFIEGMEAANKQSDALYFAHLNKINWFDLSNEELDYYKGFTVWSHFKTGNRLYSINSVIQALIREQQASPLTFNEEKIISQTIQKLHRYLYHLYQNEEIYQAKRQFRKLDPVCKVVKDRLYHKPLVNGEGQIIHQTDRIKLRYCIKTSLGNVLKSTRDRVEEIDLKRAMQGLRKGLDGLKEGSRGILYVHPEYGFRDTWDLPSIKPFLIIEFEIISIV